MEGVKCSLASCRVHDFLPFLCASCGLWFCGEHCGRALHACPSLEGEQSLPVPEGAKERGEKGGLFRRLSQAVATRFKQGERGEGSEGGREHIAVRAGPLLAWRRGEGERQRVGERLAQLQERAGRDGAAKKARELLLRRHCQERGAGARGEGERLFLALHLLEGGPLDFASFPRAWQGGRFLSELAAAYLPILLSLQRERAAEGECGEGERGYRLGVYRRESDGTLRPLSLSPSSASCALSELLSDFSDIYLALERGEAEAGAGAGRPLATESDVKDTPPLPPSLPPPPLAAFNKGERAFYFRPPPPPAPPVASLAQARALGLALSEVEVVGVHRDDPPLLYYTVREQGGERQTDALHLLPFVAEGKEGAAGGEGEEERAHGSNSVDGERDEGPALTLHIVRGRQPPLVVRVGEGTRLGELRERVARKMGVEERDRVKLKFVCRGATLKGETLSLAQLKVRDRDKVLLIG